MNRAMLMAYFNETAPTVTDAVPDRLYGPVGGYAADGGGTVCWPWAGGGGGVAAKGGGIVAACPGR